MTSLNSVQDKHRLKNIAACASVCTAIALTLIKAGAAYVTGSLSVLSSMADSLADVISSLVTLIAVTYADKPLTCDHRYGYGKAEAVSALVQAAFISGSACFILYDAAYRLHSPVLLTNTAVGIWVMLISLVLTSVLIVFQKYIIKRINSQAIEADNKHYIIDLAANLTVLLSLLSVKYWHWAWIDMAAAVAIAVYLMITAWKIAHRALEEITDKEIDAPTKAAVLKAVGEVEGVKGYHDFRSRLSGNRLFIEIHLEFDGALSLYETHRLSDAAEDKIIALYPHAQILIHQDPYGIEEKRLDNDIAGPCEL
ncbi:MAG: cation diffusion facilitator family transporter [Alphaproteobacteria bacterium]|nr:cation diffusion facilitator family transporter [Alphaproteobacteria bacterium]